MKAASFSALTYLITYFAMGVYTQPHGPQGLVLWVGFPIAIVATVVALSGLLRGQR